MQSPAEVIARADLSVIGQPECEYLTFTAAGLEYGIGILSVREIRGWTPERPLPNSPAAVRGIINLRGQVVPIYDLRVRLGSEASAPTATHVVIVVEAASGFYGILVDAVSDILKVSPSELQPVPRTSMEQEPELLTALLAREERMVSLLDLDMLVGGGEVAVEERPLIVPDMLAAQPCRSAAVTAASSSSSL